MKAFVEITGLRKQYNPPDGVYAVGKDSALDLEIYEGEIFSLLGPNGAGKTTVISMMSTLLTPSDGEIIINGHSVTKNPVDAKHQIGVVPQELALYPSLTARQNLEFFGKLYGLSGKNLKERTAAVLDIINLKDRADERIDEYSGGMKRRVNIGVGLMHSPKMVFLDEPTVAIDPQSRRNILDTVKRLNDEGMTVLYTTHYMEEAQELSDRIGIIDHGQIIALGTLDELIEKVGEQAALDLKLSHIPAELEAKLTAIEGVKSVQFDEGGAAKVILDGDKQVLPEIITALAETDVALQSADVNAPNLEAVFLHLTGRALRD